MHPYVRFKRSDGSHVDLGHGDLIGRLGSAKLCLDDPSISEAHAMVSLRGSELQLLGLRGRFVTDDKKPLSKLVLRTGQTVRLSRETTLVVDTVWLPNTVLALEGEGIGRQVLSGACSLFVGPAGLRLVPRFDPAGAAWVFNVDGAWRARIGDGPTTPLSPGDTLTLGQRRVNAVMVNLSAGPDNATHADGGISAPLRIVAKYESVHIYRTSDPVVVLTGISARLISELVATNAPTPWEVLAREVWSEDAEHADLRARFDAAMLRLRKKLRASQIREDLIRSDGHGSVEFVPYRGDLVEDQG
ncbi:MAG: hypothetical protein ACI9MR_002859 [Myxococcota bacterium]|jgi:hypothetical protein